MLLTVETMFGVGAVQLGPALTAGTTGQLTTGEEISSTTKVVVQFTLLPLASVATMVMS